MKTKIAKYESTTSISRSTFISEANEWMEGEDSGYIRASEIVEVDFRPVPEDIIIPLKVRALQAEKFAKMAEFDEKISKLMAITFQPEDCVPVEDMDENPQEEYVVSDEEAAETLESCYD